MAEPAGFAFTQGNFLALMFTMRNSASEKSCLKETSQDTGTMAHVGGRIRTLRAERQMTLDDLATKAALSKGLLSKLENNADSNPSIETLYKIAEAFDLTVADLLESGSIQAKRIIPDKKPAWVDAIAAALKQDGKKPDEDILQALYVLQSRKGASQKSDVAWLHMYRSLELNFSRGGA